MRNKIIGAVIGLLALANASQAIQYFPILYDFAGLNRDKPSFIIPQGQLMKMDNWYALPDSASTSKLGIMTKVPGGGAGATGVFEGTEDLSFPGIPATNVGMTWFNPGESDTALESLGVFVLANVSTSFEVNTPGIGSFIVGDAKWYHLTNTDGSKACFYDEGPVYFDSNFDGFRSTNTLYWTGYDRFHSPGLQTFRKLFGDLVISPSGNNLIAPPMQDVNQMVTLSSPVTATFGSLEVTGSNLTIEAYKGQWFCIQPGDPLYEINQIEDNTHLLLRTAFNGVSTSSATAQVSSATNFEPFIIMMWNNRLWMYDFFGGPSGYGKDRLACSGTQSSVTPAGLEQLTGTDTGFLDVPGSGAGSALAFIGNLFFAFKDNSYVVYQYDASVTPPISEVQRLPYGCPSMRSIQKTENGLIYYTGSEVRFTNGYNDWSLSGDINNDLKFRKNSYGIGGWYLGFPYSIFPPTSIYDETRGVYYLYFPASTGTTNTDFASYAYDTRRQIWIGQAKTPSLSDIEKVYRGNSISVQGEYIFSFADANTSLGALGDVGSTTTGEVQSGDLTFGDTKNQKLVRWVEFWVHLAAGTGTPESSVTLSFNYFADGQQMLAAPITAEVINPRTTDTESMVKIRFNVQTQCNFFRWDLQDIAYKNCSYISLVGGIIGVDSVPTN